MNDTNKQTNKLPQGTEKRMIKRAVLLYEESNSIQYNFMSESNRVALRYLAKHRGLEVVIENYKLCKDFGTSKIWDRTNKQYYPVLFAFARNAEGKITAGQSIYLDYKTSAKADIAVNKRRFGKINGSFVEIQQAPSINPKNNTPADNNITIIAKGVETALSLQEASINGKILCALVVKNIKNYQPQLNEGIIIAADNDGLNALSLKTITTAKKKLEQQGAIVSIVMPPEKGDFNDVLRTQNREAIREIIVPEIDKLVIKVEIAKSSDAENINMLQKFQNELKSLEKFVTAENVNTALKIYKQQNMETFINYSHKVCSTVIEQRITKDLQTMKNKFDPNYDLGNVKFCDVVIYDFKGKSHATPEDYLTAIGKDNQAMQYINPESTIGKQIKNELKNTSEVQKNHGISVKAI
ncbi:MAG: toprim domain-containing protein [Rickettsia endosymbiont of Pseudomimeciton antennatum]|nr:toprim domain-containing protein [Rickettsia endosymbiont of Pseudomimeciton antennatum]